MNYIETRGIWEVVPVKKCWDNLGRGPTSGRWVDVKKGRRREKQIRRQRL